MTDMIVSASDGQTRVGPADRSVRGKSKQPNWRRNADEPVSVIKLELDLSDDQTRSGVEGQWEAVYRLRKALQRDAHARVNAYWAAPHERAQDPKSVRERLGVSRKGMESAAKAHVENSKWMRDHLTKATALHVADEVWESIDRHLFADSSGKRHGKPKIGSWFDFTRIPGRAKSHTKKTRTWETYRLVGTVAGHLTMYQHPDLIKQERAVDAVPAGVSVLAQPRRLPPPVKPERGSWWGHDGVMAVVYTGLPAGDLVLPVRLPQGSGRWPHLHYFLADPSVWHRIDLVRVQDRKTQGGWRYYAHLMVLKPGYVSESTRERRSATPTDRHAGVDGNVSNLAVVSVNATGHADLRMGHVKVSEQQRQTSTRAAQKARRRQKALDRSRRSANTDQYDQSVRQAKRAARRSADGLTERQVLTPTGARVANKAGAPKRAYRRDTLSKTYRKTRADHASDSRATSQAKQARAKHLAAQIIATHGANLVVEDCNISTWAKLWGKGIQLFSPGMLIKALEQEAKANGGELLKASTRTTAMSQHCLCGQRVSKTLADRVHNCPSCGLGADRDLISAALAACVTFTDSANPSTAKVDYELAKNLASWWEAQQEAPAWSTAPTTSPTTGETGRDGSTTVPLLGKLPATRPTPEQPTHSGRRRNRRTKTRRKHLERQQDPLRVKS
ncbi:transposase [Candidatus Nanopelagicales bacterium]|nr:transposase [Candidatus Nanopelagicales bacterium]